MNVRYLVKYNILNILETTHIVINVTDLIKKDKLDTIYDIIEFYNKYNENVLIILYHFGFDTKFIKFSNVIELSLNDDCGSFIINKLRDILNIKHIDYNILGINTNLDNLDIDIFNRIISIKNINLSKLKYLDINEIITYNNLHILNEVLKMNIKKIRFNKIKFKNLLLNLSILNNLLKSNHKSIVIKHLKEFMYNDDLDIIEYLSNSSKILNVLISTITQYDNNDITQEDYNNINDAFRILL